MIGSRGTGTTYYSNAAQGPVSIPLYGAPGNYVPRTKSLNIFIRITAVALAALLAGCSLNPFAGDDDAAVPTPAPAPPPSYDNAPQSSAPEYSAPVVERVSQPVPLADNHPNEYVVQVGDTLWDIAATFLKDPWYWPEIWYINPQIENPHLIYPGDVLALVYVDGQPRITNVRASTYRLSPEARVTPIDRGDHQRLLRVDFGVPVERRGTGETRDGSAAVPARDTWRSPHRSGRQHGLRSRPGRRSAGRALQRRARRRPADRPGRQQAHRLPGHHYRRRHAAPYAAIRQRWH